MTLAAAKAFAVACWTMDEASGTRVDSVGSNDLADNNTVASVAGMFSNAADFESGNSEYLSIGDVTDLRMSDIDMMVRVWVKIESVSGGFDAMVYKVEPGGAEGEYFLYTQAGPAVGWGVTANGVVGAGTFINTASLSTGTWYLIHAWHDATANEVGISVNAGTPVTASHAGGIYSGASRFGCGYNPSNGVQFYDGLMDDLVILKNRFLDATERTADYAGGTGVAFDQWDAGGGPPAAKRLAALCVG